MVINPDLSNGFDPILEMVSMKQGRLFSTEKPLATEASIAVDEIVCKTIISKSGLYGIDYSINPYISCQHDCVYCFARSMYERHGQSDSSREWGEFVAAKINAVPILQKQLRRIKRGTILVSSVTDPYQPVEQHFRLTRRLLSHLSGREFQITVLTKNALISRDIDIFQENSHWEIGLTLTTVDDDLRSLIEPQASSVEERIGALRTLATAGITTFAFLGPMLPFVSEAALSELLDALAEVNVSYVMIDRLNLKRGSVQRLNPVLKEILPRRTEAFFDACRQNSLYFAKLKERIRDECAHRDLQSHFCY
ncbi:MAG: radical SAM protein [Candidatus Hodarchaeales archaeon]